LTNAQGLVRLQALRPFASQALSIDQSTLPDAALRPKFQSISVVPRPGVINRIEFPLYPTGDVDGTLWLRRDGRKIPAGGLTLQLVDDSGNVKSAGRTDQDGYYVLEGVEYGRYALRVDPEQALKLGLRTGGARLIAISDDKPSLSGQDLTLSMATVASDAPRLEMPVPIWAN
jgi:outer membrane usher protein FimD/PapC